MPEVIASRGVRRSAVRASARRQLRPRQRNPLVAAPVVDLDPGGVGVVAARAADCEVWVRADGVWSSLFPQDMLTAQARAVWSARPRPVSLEENWRQQEMLLDDPAAWVCPCVGLTSPGWWRRHRHQGRVR